MQVSKSRRSFYLQVLVLAARRTKLRKFGRARRSSRRPKVTILIWKDRYLSHASRRSGMKPFGSTMRPRTYFLPRHVRSKTTSYCELATNQSHKVLSENTSSSCSTPTTTRLCTCSSLVGFINCENLRQSKPAIRGMSSSPLVVAFPPLIGVIVVVSEEGNHLGVQVRLMRRCLVTRRRAGFAPDSNLGAEGGAGIPKDGPEGYNPHAFKTWWNGGSPLMEDQDACGGATWMPKVHPGLGIPLEELTFRTDFDEAAQHHIMSGGKFTALVQKYETALRAAKDKAFVLRREREMAKDVDTMVADLQQDKLVLESKVAALNREIVVRR
ncbi:unnamed protein product [Microthlaspi erraticum]|uniref:Uncharacterized protein n=1 Tax=Microthlaspi erraticum TaxID=1685480 RepID=A0A6D2KCM0_9BRAS|nr:unnamed protein product [Microthlaspi erraticum]